jgi:hypothetical protein
MTYRLFDVATHHLQQPEAFSIPREAERLHLEQGEIVSIGLVPESGETPEWMWARVEMVRGEGRYIGALLDKPKTVPALMAGNRIEFTFTHVLELYIEEGDARWIDQSKLAMVSGYIVNDNAWPGKLMRIPPMAPEYSGWVIFNGTEPPQYASDFSNFLSAPLEEAIRRYPNLQSGLASPVGSEWRWDPESCEYKSSK